MEVIIHRGTHQIGGCATEYRTKNTRIFIDFGAELDSENAKPFDIEGVTKGKTNCDDKYHKSYQLDMMEVCQDMYENGFEFISEHIKNDTFESFFIEEGKLRPKLKYN